jgi:hypothetical protein
MGGYPGFPCTKIYDFSYRCWLQRMGFVTFWSSKHPPAPRKTTVDMTNYAFSRSHWMDHRLNHFVDGAKNRELPRRSANLMYSN